MRRLTAWREDEDGHTAIEYALIAAIFAIASVGAYTALHNSVSNMFTTINTELNNASTTN